jgi:hypothetical protein
MHVTTQHLVSNRSTIHHQKEHRKKTHHQHNIDGYNAGSQFLPIFIVVEDALLPRGVIPVNLSSRQPRARQSRIRYLCARRPPTSWRLVNLRLVLD